MPFALTHEGQTLVTTNKVDTKEDARSMLWWVFLAKYRLKSGKGWKKAKPCKFHECKIEETT